MNKLKLLKKNTNTHLHKSVVKKITDPKYSYFTKIVKSKQIIFKCFSNNVIGKKLHLDNKNFNAQIIPKCFSDKMKYSARLIQKSYYTIDKESDMIINEQPNNHTRKESDTIINKQNKCNDVHEQPNSFVENLMVSAICVLTFLCAFFGSFILLDNIAILFWLIIYWIIVIAILFIAEILSFIRTLSILNVTG